MCSTSTTAAPRNPGTCVIIHSGADSDEHVVLYHVGAETEEHIGLDDGYTYNKDNGVVQGPAGCSALGNRVAVTEGAAMSATWFGIARTTSSAAPAHCTARRLGPLDRAPSP